MSLLYKYALIIQVHNEFDFPANEDGSEYLSQCIQLLGDNICEAAALVETIDWKSQGREVIEYAAAMFDTPQHEHSKDVLCVAKSALYEHLTNFERKIHDELQKIDAMVEDCIEE